jgi:hypothetical protein
MSIQRHVKARLRKAEPICPSFKTPTSRFCVFRLSIEVRVICHQYSFADIEDGMEVRAINSHAVHQTTVYSDLVDPPWYFKGVVCLQKGP